MAIDIMTSRRGYFEECQWWKRDEDEELDNDELVMNHQPQGIFYAKEIIPEQNSSNKFYGVIMLNRDTVTIKTNDDILGIERGCLVKYQQELWIVDAVRMEHYRNGMMEFSFESNASHSWTLSLRK